MSEVWTADCILIKLRTKFRKGFKKPMASTLEVLGKAVLGIVVLGWSKGVAVASCRIYEVSFSVQSEPESCLFGSFMGMWLLASF